MVSIAEHLFKLRPSIFPHFQNFVFNLIGGKVTFFSLETEISSVFMKPCKSSWYAIGSY